MIPRADPLVGLRRLSRPAPDPPPSEADAVERCEMCSAEIPARHGHVADLEAHRLLCTCRACFLLFTGSGAGGGRFLAVPQDVRRVTDVAISEGQWAALQIPVDLAFFLRQTGAENVGAYYPGPGGATESLLDLASWAEVLDANPVLAHAEPDVRAILLRRSASGYACYLVPVDRCYELVGIVRQSWVGFHGGADVWARVGAFFAELDREARAVDRTGQAVPGA